MPTCRRITSITAMSATVVGLAIPLDIIAPAAAAPCSVSGGPSARSQQVAPTLPVEHIPIGRKPPTATANLPAPEANRPRARIAVAESTTLVSWLTGPNTDSYARFGISGADLGVMWDNGHTGAGNQVLVAFGDTFGNCNVAGQEWRNNTLFRSADRNLADGMAVPNPVPGDTHAGSPVTASRPNFCRQVIESLNLAATEVTVIPTAGISVDTTQYVNFMSVSQWGAPGQWSTNFSAVAVSDDNGETWTVPRSSIRPSWFNSAPGSLFIWGYQNFQMGAYLRHGGYVYNYGTTAGRGGAPFLARVPENAITDVWAYEYHTPFGWLRWLPFLAVQVVWGPASEMSVAYNDHLQKFIMLYTDPLSNVVMRTADKPEGPWSSAQTILASADMPGGIYAPYIHPWSSGRDLYFTVSLWSNYSVALMRYALPQTG